MQRLFPAGRFDAPRGAMRGAGPWFMDAGIAAQVIARAASRSTRIPIDYEHQILMSAENGQPAPAAGWVDPKTLVWREDGDEPGLYGEVKWTARATALLDADEYAYLSPVFPYDGETGAVLDLLHVALTNTPAIDEPILAAMSARYTTTPKEDSMELLKKLLAALGLPEATSEADALAGVAALKTKADGAQAEIAALKGAAPDPAKFVPIEAVQGLQSQLAALAGRINDDEAGRLIDAAMVDGRLTEDLREWAVSLGKSNVAALKEYIAKAQPIAALKGMQTQDKQPSGTGGQGSLSAAELGVCKALGLRPEEYVKGKEVAK
ncbi:protease (I) and scaffold (Z) protein [Pseudothauera rhizosphaerae]|uniref:Protease (I) and scaffold (Z) protein n=2 Tax=Pseudothauera rhizosphaerae TaxID=2565932 RepID=A0A4S4AN28_9RHOO|nr:protease (I) and scaffold (Z) protein [Pseudothauera rhizosphaerae]